VCVCILSSPGRVFPLLPVHMDCPFLIAPSVVSNVYYDVMNI
jgi:hypothetical protein